MSAKQTTRVQIELPEKSMARLGLLKEKTEATSYAEVFRNALRLYESIINEYEAGNRVLIKNQNGEIKEYEIFY